jgi:hypothetical protein
VTQQKMKINLRLCAKGIDFTTYQRERGEETADPNVWLRRGIADLDFDPIYFLATGETSLEGWAK